MGLYFFAFCGVLGCFSAVFLFHFGVCGPCLCVSPWPCGGPEWLLTRFCRSTIAEFSSSLWVAWFCCILGGGGTTGCCCWPAREDERGCTRSRDLGLSALLDRFLCSDDDDRQFLDVEVNIWLRRQGYAKPARHTNGKKQKNKKKNLRAVPEHSNGPLARQEEATPTCSRAADWKMDQACNDAWCFSQHSMADSAVQHSSESDKLPWSETEEHRQAQ